VPGVLPPAAFAAVVILAATGGWHGAEGKSCTNAFPRLRSHTERGAAQLRTCGTRRCRSPTTSSTSPPPSGPPGCRLCRGGSEEPLEWPMLYRKLRRRGRCCVPLRGLPCKTCVLRRAARTGNPSRPTWSSCSFWWTSTASSGGFASKPA
jgi:hypothetical protein